MMIMKKSKIAVVLMIVCCMTLLAGCGSLSGNVAGHASSDRYSIVCTTYPQYDWVKQIIGEDSGFSVELLLKNGVDMHSYQPTAEDMYKIASADMFVYVGGSSDKWVSDALKNSQNKDMKVVNMMEILGDKAKIEELVEGMQGEEHEHGNEDHEHGEVIEYDEHIWLSLNNAAIMTQALAENLKKIDEQNADRFMANAKAYIEKLNDLDSRYKEAVSEAKIKTVLFADRFPFRYMMDEYGLQYYAAFPGCSAETEASFETVTFLSGKADELGLRAIYVIENSDKKIAETIKNNTKAKNQEIIVINSMQSVSAKDMENGTSYLGIMEDNLAALKKGL